MEKKTQEIELVIKKEIAPIVKIALGLVVDSGEKMKVATETLSKLNKFVDKVTEEKEKVTKPLNQALKAERARWKPIEDMFKDGIESLRTKIGDYQTEQVQIKKEEEAKISARVGEGKGKLKFETAVRKMGEIDTPETRINTDEGMIKFRTIAELEIIDTTMIPDQYWIIDEKKIVEALKAGINVEGAILIEKQIPVNIR